MKRKRKLPHNYPLVMSTELRAEAKRVAAAEGRSLAAQIRLWIAEGIERKKAQEGENG